MDMKSLRGFKREAKRGIFDDVGLNWPVWVCRHVSLTEPGLGANSQHVCT